MRDAVPESRSNSISCHARDQTPIRSFYNTVSGVQRLRPNSSLAIYLFQMGHSKEDNAMKLRFTEFGGLVPPAEDLAFSVASITGEQISVEVLVVPLLLQVMIITRLLMNMNCSGNQNGFMICRAIKLCEPALVSGDPTVTKIGNYQEGLVETFMKEAVMHTSLVERVLPSVFWDGFFLNCVGQNWCKVTVSPENFGGDPCPNVLKKLSVEAICT
ncbi:hypothetical protein RJT34_28267 [Clitoria ternatea]|uniref:SUEL-type lectin domain-containing protein n=1 Tax=Clitoria ternatea TaxID=43366 RepID=A0AAN9F8I9_CLITE